MSSASYGAHKETGGAGSSEATCLGASPGCMRTSQKCQPLTMLPSSGCSVWGLPFLVPLWYVALPAQRYSKDKSLYKLESRVQLLPDRHCTSRCVQGRGERVGVTISPLVDPWVHPMGAECQEASPWQSPAVQLPCGGLWVLDFHTHRAHWQRSDEGRLLQYVAKRNDILKRLYLSFCVRQRLVLLNAQHLKFRCWIKHLSGFWALSDRGATCFVRNKNHWEYAPNAWAFYECGDQNT